MRTAYREHLDNFSHDLIVMCDIVRTIMDKASRALLDRALELAEEALSLTEELDEIRSRCSERAVKLLALENPMAQDLRQVVSSIYIIEDLFRMGQLAQHIADSARRRHPEAVVPNKYLGFMEEMFRLTQDMGAVVHDILVTPDAELSVNVRSDDDAVDDINHHLLRILTQREWDGTVRQAVETAQITRYYERYADHCVSVAGRIIYFATGLLPEEFEKKLQEDQKDAEFEARMSELERQFRR
ncbi:phosphate signaling complex protein PhoU [Corynebacterium macginleyi]|uniref:Phosphate transport system regulatory protein PhoU n=1 Tax=Corynebacterium macginleyi TaxID=38290 RepID=A0A3M0GCK5_9CORY|nr:phosphate signaling complex protein PhoU [Corynebacterium macginleyi]RMB62540.1 phosphate transport system regulatory protein PhoU [Corynebacterium macginleyi]